MLFHFCYIQKHFTRLGKWYRQLVAWASSFTHPDLHSHFFRPCRKCRKKTKKHSIHKLFSPHLFGLILSFRVRARYIHQLFHKRWVSLTFALRYTCPARVRLSRLWSIGRAACRVWPALPACRESEWKWRISIIRSAGTRWPSPSCSSSSRRYSWWISAFRSDIVPGNSALSFWTS